ncbi:LysR family transcriptional regulator [Pseudonocardia sp. WMMC193]|uniref:LysR family transcriptional regulator n=1 Tax=Pseudonocardia sp. WMMC193 TaxID=2911965 RepID=UPI001F2BD06B|nr:LysR family transcriptional regulator [Pseudonocardia sp. WMMC193]MCF7550658.1 LysR family transcriptional regulator [Pseudonocardia sp. WMMC193]
MELRNLRHFSALAETLNYRVAAARLHLTQPALTRSIVALERQLGVQLFDRDKRHVALTAEGAELLERAGEVLVDADRLAAAADAIRARRREEVRVALYGMALAELTHPVIEAFRERYPHVRIQVHEADFHQGLAPLLAGECDVALLSLSVDIPGLTRVPIFTEPVSLALWTGHPLASATAVDMTEVYDLPWVTPHPEDDLWVGGRRGDHDAPTVGSHARSVLDMSWKIAYQHMVGLIPLSGARMFPHPGLQAVAPKEHLDSVAAVAYPSTGHSPAAPAFAEVALRVARRATAVPHAELPR